MLGLRLLAAAVLLCLVASVPAHAFVRTMSTSGQPLFWPNPSVNIRANPTNSSGLSAAQVSSMLSAAYGAWQIASSRVNVSYVQSTSGPTGSREDGVNAAYFASNSGQALDWGVVALTEVFYDVGSGQIHEADTAFNDNQFLFTDTPGQTGTAVNGRTAVYLQDVATHEAGHMLGLDHSLINLSSLIYTAFNGQFSLSADESNAIRTIYPSSSQSGGSLSGTVKGTDGGIFGTHVMAVNLVTGQVEAGTLATSDGSFNLGSVPAGKYAVMMEPFGNQISSVSSYYQNVDHRFCAGSLFRRRFYSSCESTGGASVMEVSAGSSSSLGTLSPSCDAMGNPGGTPNSVAAAKEISNQGGASFGTMKPGDTHYYVVHGASGSLQARAISYSLYSPVDVKIQITDLSGNPVAGSTSVDNVASPGPGGVTNYDSVATANVSTGDYLLKITSSANAIPPTAFSDGYELEDADGHYLVALAVNGDVAETPASDMSSCVSVPNIAQNATIQNAPAAPAQATTSGCGSLSSGDGPFSGGMTQVLAVALFLHLLSMVVRLRRRLASARSGRR